LSLFLLQSASVVGRSADQKVEADLVLSGQSIISPGFLKALRDNSKPEGEEEPLFVAAESLAQLSPGQSLGCKGIGVDEKQTSPAYRCVLRWWGWGCMVTIVMMRMMIVVRDACCTGGGVHLCSPWDHLCAPLTALFPCRFTQGSFVKTMEELGIGRPSTYASIIEVLRTRQYFTQRGSSMVPTVLGFVVVQLLDRHFPDFVDAGFTSRMEAALDGIAKGEVGRFGKTVMHREMWPQ
jgi:DNA topoisomerase IA